jgi:hypothetical protein
MPDLWLALPAKPGGEGVDTIFTGGIERRMEDRFINGHGPYNGTRDSVRLGDSGMPEACADDAPLEGACPTCQTQANFRRWTG